MVVYEVGIISSAGLPVFHIDLRPGVSGDPLMTAGFLTALQQFVNSTFSDETQSFAMKKFVIYVSQITLLKEQASVYVISERGKNQKAIQDKIKTVSKKVIEVFPSLTDCFDVMETLQGKEIIEFMKKEFADLRIKPEERARKLFG
ncbi:MAG: hypothetical protein ACXAC8_15420 [Candidatus Hodarchaeales archaeon]|jgi:hypothetical protein